METKVEPNSTIENSKYLKRKDEAFELVRCSISLNILYHIEPEKYPNGIWTELYSLFKKQDEMRGHQLEIKLLNLSLGKFQSIQGFFIKFKYISLRLNMCKINKDNDQLVLLENIFYT